MTSPPTLRRHRDFNRLWAGLAISQLGSAVGNVALPVVAVLVVGASAFEVSVLAGIASLVTVLASLPMGSHVEFRRKRPVMIAADLLRFAAGASIPIAAALGVLGFAQLCAVAAVYALGQLAFTAASQANLVNLVSRDRLMDANGRMQSTTWLGVTLGPAAGGGLIAALSAVNTVLVDAVSYLASAAAVWRIRTAEPDPPRRESGSRRADLTAGLRFVASRPALRRLLIGWMIFAGCSGAMAPLSTLFYLRDLRFSAWQYGLLMGVPSIAGFVGSRLAHRAARRLGDTRALWWASVLRGPWNLLIVIAPPGAAGLAMCAMGFGGTLFFSSLANSIMVGHRQRLTPDGLLTRVATLWSLATTVAQPLFVVAGGVLAAGLGTRGTLAAVAAVMAVSGFILVRGKDSPATR